MVRPRLPAGSMARACLALVIAVLLAKARASALDRDDPSVHPSSGDVGQPLAIPVQSGRARFSLPMTRPGSQTLVIVSTLSKGPGPHAMRLTARSVDRAERIEPITRAHHVRPKQAAFATGALPPQSAARPAGHRTFYLMVQDGESSDPSNYRTLSARLVGVGRRVQVYHDSAGTDGVDPSTIREILSTFDDQVFPQAARRFGPAFDTDGDGRFTVLLSGWLSRLSGGKVRVDGFVRGADLDPALASPFGNRCDMMYLNDSLRAGPHLRTVMAHEYAHAVTFSRKTLADPARGMIGPEEEGWLDEAIAHLVEDHHGFSTSNIDYRVSAFLSQPERYRLVVDDYYAAGLFRSHGNRGATYLFLRWCVDSYGPGLLDQLVRSRLRGVANLESATGSSFADLFRGWTVALYLSGLDPARSPDQSYRSVDLRGLLEEWILAGPRTSVVRPDVLEDRWTAEGTTAHYALVSRGSRAAVEVEVEGPSQAEIQVTAIPLPSGLGRPELTVRPSSDPSGVVRIQAEVSDPEGTPVRLGALAWEPLVPDADPIGSRFRRDGLDMLGIASAFGTSAVPASGLLRSRPIRLPGVRSGDGPLVFKAVGTDPGGRRVAAWAVATPPPRPVVAVDRNTTIP